MMKEANVSHLVLDAAAFLSYSKPETIGRQIYTTQAVVNEIRDKKIRERLQCLPYDLQITEPEPSDVKIVTDFSKKTGDYPSLSETDLRVLALCYRLHCQHVGADTIKTEPTVQKSVSTTTVTPSNPRTIAGFHVPQNKPEGSSRQPSRMSSDTKSPNPPAPSSGDQLPELSNENLCDTPANTDNSPDHGDESIKSHDETNHATEVSNNEHTHENQEDDLGREFSDSDVSVSGSESEEFDENVNDDEADWITPDNLSEAVKSMRLGEEEESSGIEVACLTTDFAVQNVLMQMGMNIVSIDGMLIKQLRTYVLRCFSCLKTTSVMTKRFCPSCGNYTLKKVAIQVRPDGSMKLFLSRRKPPTSRGLRYSLPAPQGGKHAVNPILFEDQRIPENRLSRKAYQRLNVFDPEYIAGGSPFAERDTTSRSAFLGLHKYNKMVSSGRVGNDTRRGKKRGGKKR